MPKNLKPMDITVTNEQGQPLPDVIIMVVDGPASFPDVASVTDAQGKGSLGQLTVPGQYTLLLNHNQQQIHKPVQVSPGQSITVAIP